MGFAVCVGSAGYGFQSEYLAKAVDLFSGKIQRIVIPAK